MIIIGDIIMSDQDVKTTRQISKETILKREFNGLKKELATIDAKIASFEDLQEAREAIVLRLPLVQQELMAEMGLDIEFDKGA
jgi:hypothetical protein